MKPMVYTKQNVLAFLDKRKFQTRRIINPQPIGKVTRIERRGTINNFHAIYGRQVGCGKGREWKPRFEVGDEVYVAEGYQIVDTDMHNPAIPKIEGVYLADNNCFSVEFTDHEWDLWCKRNYPYRSTSGRFMYKSLARIFYTITEVRVERLQDISPKDCIAESITLIGDELVFNNRKQKDSLRITKFYRLWKSIHGNDSWNKWVFVYVWDEIRIEEK